MLINALERQFVDEGDQRTAVARSAVGVTFERYDFNDGPYLGFERSCDFYGDGSMVIVPAPGHTPGSIVIFVTLPDGKRYAF